MKAFSSRFSSPLQFIIMSYQDLKCTVVKCFQENNVEILQNILKCLEKRFDDLLINKRDSPDIRIDNSVNKQWDLCRRAREISTTTRKRAIRYVRFFLYTIQTLIGLLRWVNFLCFVCCGVQPFQVNLCERREVFIDEVTSSRFYISVFVL